MKITNHGAYLIKLTWYGLVNAYFVREADGLTLIDSAIGGKGPDILAAARQIGAPITCLLFTHAHADHVGSLDELHRALPDVEVAITARDARFLSGDRSLDPQEAQVPLHGGYPVISTRPTRLLQAGDRIGSLELVPSPGHTPGHAAFLDTRDNSLIAGDAFQTQGGIAVSGVIKIMFPLVAMSSWHLPTAVQSARTLRDLNPSRLAVGHGRVLEQPVPSMDQAIAVAARTSEPVRHGV